MNLHSIEVLQTLIHMMYSAHLALPAWCACISEYFIIVAMPPWGGGMEIQIAEYSYMCSLGAFLQVTYIVLFQINRASNYYAWIVIEAFCMQEVTLVA